MRGVRAETLHAIILLALFVGLGFSIWSAWETTHPQGGQICDVTTGVSCSKVSQSGDTSIYGIPYWSVGIAGFVAMIIVDIPLYVSWRRDLLIVLTVLSILGALATLYLIYQEVAVVHAVCPVCTGAHVSNFAVLVSAALRLRKARRTEADADG